MAENKKRKLTEKDQTSFFDEEMMAEEPQIPEETDSDTKKNTSADSAQEEDIGAGSGFLFDLNEYGSESECRRKRHRSDRFGGDFSRAGRKRRG